MPTLDLMRVSILSGNVIKSLIISTVIFPFSPEQKAVRFSRLSGKMFICSLCEILQLPEADLKMQER